MIIGIGTDVLEIWRIENAARQKNFLKKIFTDREIEYLRSINFKAETLASSFSGKEAVSKALKTGFRGFGFKDIEILRDDIGCPYVILHNGALRRAVELDYSRVHITLSHDRKRTTAFAILEGGGSIKDMETVRKYNKSPYIYAAAEYKSCEETDLEKIKYEKFISSKIPVRNDDGHKGDYGRDLIIAGSRGYAGAAYLAAEGALKSGGGLVTLACHEEVWDVMSIKLTEAMTMTVEDGKRLMDMAEKADSIAIGPGLGCNENTLELLKEILRIRKCPVVIDADAISCLEGRTDILKNGGENIIITPHAGEMSRITGLSIKHIMEHRKEAAESFARDHGVVVLLKGKNTIITDGSKTYVNCTGSSAMASGGMGDALTGIIAGLIGQGMEPMDAAACGAYIHGKAGDILARTQYSILAQDVLKIIPYVMKDIVPK